MVHATRDRSAGGKTSGGVQRFNLVISDTSGRVLAEILRFCVRVMKSASTKSPAPLEAQDRAVMAVPEWRESSLVGTADSVDVALIFGDAPSDWGDLAQRITRVGPGSAWYSMANGANPAIYRIRPHQAEDYRRLFDDMARRDRLPQVVAMAPWTETEANPAEWVTSELEALFLFVRAWLESKPAKGSRLMFVVGSGPDDGRSEFLVGAVEGFFRSLQTETRKIVWKIVHADALSPERIHGELDFVETPGEIVRFQNGRRYVKAWRKAPAITEASLPLKRDGVYWITGGAGGLGAVLARNIAQQGPVKLLLSGRSRLTDTGQALLDELTELGATVAYVEADVSRRDHMERAIGILKQRFGALNGVVHAAGLIRDCVLTKKQWEDFEAVLAPKIQGASLLDEVTREEPLDFFVLFSSIASAFGNIGQTDYAAANGYMDAFAAVREGWRAEGLRAGRSLSINWCLWRNGGMQLDAATNERMFRITGMRPLDTQLGLSLLATILAGSHSQAAIMVGDETKILRCFPVDGGTADASVAQPESATVRNGAASDTSDKTSHETPPAAASLPAKELEATVIGEITGMFMEFLKLDEEDIDIDMDFTEYGIDSIMIIKMLERVEEVHGQTVDPNVMLEFTTIRELAGYLCDEVLAHSGAATNGNDPSSHAMPTLEIEAIEPQEIVERAAEVESPVSHREEPSSGAEQEEPAPVQAAESPPQADVDLMRAAQPAGTKSAGAYKGLVGDHAAQEPIAVVGMACRFPQSPTLEAFWRNLEEGRNLVTEVPASRWDVERFFSPDKSAPYKSYSKWGGFIDGVDLFDARFFNVSDEDAVTMDPQQRIMLEMTQELLERSGYPADSLSGKRVAVLIGGGMNSYSASGIEQFDSREMERIIVNRCTNMMAARVSDYFNFKGASQIVDTACSSSLVCAHQACRLIRSGEAEAAVVGGIELLIDPFFHIGFSKARVLSDDGVSYVFDERAKGFVLGEGAGLVMLKSLSQARADGDRIHALIMGSSVNNDGKTMGVTVPNQKGQMEAIEAAIREGNIAPQSIGYLETHGTGTLLGDPIEIKAATLVYRQFTDAVGYCAVGSVKSNMGHLCRAAGIASFIKMALALDKQVMPSTLNCTRPHGRFHFETSPFFPIAETRAWTSGSDPRRAAVSSFGFGGTNCHLIMQEADARDRTGDDLRAPLPLTRFNRKSYWKTDAIGSPSSQESSTVEPVAAGPAHVATEQAEADPTDPKDEFYSALLQDLSTGRIDVDEALERARTTDAEL
jgi:polyketide synthase PksN